MSEKFFATPIPSGYPQNGKLSSGRSSKPSSCCGNGRGVAGGSIARLSGAAWTRWTD